MPRIAFILPDLGGGGAERVALTLVAEFAKGGHEIDLVVMRKRGEFLLQLPSAVRLFDLHATRLRNVIRPLAKYLSERRPQAVHVSMWPLTVAAVIARWMVASPARLLLSDHATLSQQYQGRAMRSVLRLTTRLFYPMADARVVVSQGAAKDLSKLSGLDLSRFEVIYNPIPRPSPSDLRRPDAARLWGVADGRILTVGNLHPVKNHALLLRAFARLRRRRPARLMILGEGPCRHSLSALAEELGVTDDVLMPGFAPNPWPYYASADLFVLSSDSEGFGNVLVEAMRCGLPLVSTDCPFGPSEILAGGTYGHLVRVKDEGALADALFETLESPVDRKALKRRAEMLCGQESVRRYLDLLLR